MQALGQVRAATDCPTAQCAPHVFMQCGAPAEARNHPWIDSSFVERVSRPGARDGRSTPYPERCVRCTAFHSAHSAHSPLRILDVV